MEPRALPPLPLRQAWAAGACTLQGEGQTVRNGFLEWDTELMVKESLQTRGLALKFVFSDTVPDLDQGDEFPYRDGPALRCL